MIEQWVTPGLLSPWNAGFTLFLLGAAVGSFSSVVVARVPQGQSIVRPGSHCPNCKHPLQAPDLVPIASYLWLRGRCRHCRTTIPWRYPALEAVAAVAAGLAGALSGWTAGLLVVCLWVVGAFLYAGAQRRRVIADQSGFTLIEVLVACLLLSLVMGGTFQAINMGRKSALAVERRTLATGIARERFSQAFVDAAKAVQANSAPSNTTWFYGNYQVVTTYTQRAANTWWVQVAVTCPSCKGAGPSSGAEVTLTGVVSP